MVNTYLGFNIFLYKMLSEFIGTKKEHNKRFGNHLKNLMKKQSVGTNELARRMLRSPSVIVKARGGKTNPSSYFMEELAHGLELTKNEVKDF